MLKLSLIPDPIVQSKILPLCWHLLITIKIAAHPPTLNLPFFLQMMEHQILHLSQALRKSSEKLRKIPVNRPFFKVSTFWNAEVWLITSGVGFARVGWPLTRYVKNWNSNTAIWTWWAKYSRLQFGRMTICIVIQGQAPPWPGRRETSVAKRNCNRKIYRFTKSFKVAHLHPCRMLKCWSWKSRNGRIWSIYYQLVWQIKKESKW